MSDATVQPGAAPADAVSPVSDGRRMLTAREKIGLGALVLGGVAAVALLEHLWAEPLVEAIGRAGGRLLGDLWLPAGEVPGATTG